MDVFTELNEDLFSQNQGESIKRLFTLVNVFSRVRSKRQFNMQRLKEGEHQKLMRSAYPREFEEMEIQREALMQALLEKQQRSRDKKQGTLEMPDRPSRKR